jgi:hypothetical protein
MKKSKVLYSLSMGVLAILESKLHIDQVVCVIGATKFHSPQQAIENYGSTYWDKFPAERVKKTVLEVWAILHQPRLFSDDVRQSIVDGWCFDVEEQRFISPYAK